MPSAPEIIRQAKRVLRAKLRAALLDFPPDRRAEESRALCAAVRGLSCWKNARTVTLFCPMPFEVNLTDLLRDRKRFLFPLTHDDRTLTWHLASSLTDLRPGRMGILEPDPGQSPAMDPAEMDVVLVPGLGFTTTGWRLGHGGGYYDRFLAGIRPGAETVAACFSCQLVETAEMPVEPHDIPIGRVLMGGAA